MSTQISICLPVFDGEKHLAAAIESVLRQSCSNFELLIADDCSSDASVEIIRLYAAQDQRIVWWRNEKSLGLFQNYNACIERATGNYIKLFAQDDLLEPACLERMGNVLDVIPAVNLVSCARRVIDESMDEGNESVMRNDLAKGLVLNAESIVLKSLLTLSNHIGEPAAVMFRASAKDKGFDTRYHHVGDLEYWLRICLSGACYFLDEVLCTFRIHPSGRTAFNKRNFLFALDFLRMEESFSTVLERNGVTPHDFRKICVDALSVDLEYSVRNGLFDLDDRRSTLSALKDLYSGADANERLMADLVLFRDLATSALYTLGAERAAAAKELSKMELIANKRESRLRGMLSSFSWKSTKWLRDLKRSLRDRAKSGHPSKVEEGLEDNFDDQMLYLIYLRRQIGKVSRSSSWKITSPLRKLSGRDE